MKGFKKMLAVMLSVMMVFCMVPAMGASAETTDVTEMSIGTVAELEALCDGLNNGEFASTITVTLTQNLDLGGITWTPIKSFAGEFNGNRKTISNFKINATAGSGGFFGNLGWNCDLGQMGHVVTDCSADVDVTTKVAPAGGFIGHIVDGNPKYDGRYPAGTDEITIADCSILSNVTGEDGKTGGIVGYIEDGTKVTLTDNKYAVMPRWNPCVDPETVLDENENEYSDTYTVTVALDGEGAFPVLLKFLPVTA